MGQLFRSLLPTAVIPAKAGTQWDASSAAGAESPHRVPAFAGMTPVGGQTGRMSTIVSPSAMSAGGLGTSEEGVAS
jgi:hypothetical protein